MFQSRSRRDEIAKRERDVADRRREASEYRRETKAVVTRVTTGSLNPDPEFARGWKNQRAGNQNIRDANARDAEEMLARAKKRWWQS